MILSWHALSMHFFLDSALRLFHTGSDQITFGTDYRGVVDAYTSATTRESLVGGLMQDSSPVSTPKRNPKELKDLDDFCPVCDLPYRFCRCGDEREAD